MHVIFVSFFSLLLFLYVSFLSSPFTFHDATMLWEMLAQSLDNRASMLNIELYPLPTHRKTATLLYWIRA